MATATVARPAQALRNRRDAPRLSLSKRHANMDNSTDGTAAKKRRLNEPYVRTSAHILKKHQGKSPSLILHLHQTHFRFDEQDGSFAYDSPMKFLLQHLRNQTVPHEMLEELLVNNVPFYDGCLIVEVHNHRTMENRQESRKDSGPGDTIKFSMHNYNEHITPSPMVPYPSKARTDGTPEKVVQAAADMPAPEKPKEKDGPKITTLVLHPTALTAHQEMLILAKTPASEARGKKKSIDGATPSTAQPPTPQISVPPTPISQTARGQLPQNQKMCLEESDFYSFQAEMLVATEPPLYLEPVDNPQDSQKVMDMLQHPLHQDSPPSMKSRKRTTAEMAADDAQAAETERRMLIMDERIKASGAGAAANENQQAAASLGFSRFKTLEMVRQQHEEKARAKKEEEDRLSAEKRQADENAQAQQRVLQQQQRQQQLMLAQQAQQQPTQQQLIMAQQTQQMRARAMAQAQQAQMTAQNHAHPQSGNMITAQQHSFQHPNQSVMQQASPVARNHTPMNSSPPIPQSGFPMAQTTSQGAGSPPRPASATMAHPNAMARQLSQQQHPSRNNTPQVPQGTPSMPQAMPNRQMSQTPRMPPVSPAAGLQQGTPTSASMLLQNSQIGNQQNLTPQQQMIMAQRMQMGQNPGMQAESPPQNMTPEQFQQFSHLQRQQFQRQLMQHHNGAQMSQQQFAQMKQRQLAMQRSQMMAQQQLQQQQQQQQQQQNVQMHGNVGQAGSPGGFPQQTPQMSHAHPQQQTNGHEQSQLTPQQQQQNSMARAQQISQFRVQQQQHLQAQLQPLLAQYGNLSNIPSTIVSGLPPATQQLIRNQIMRAQQAQAIRLQAQQQMRLQQQGGQNHGSAEQVPGGPPNPQYMQQLRNSQAMMRAQMQQQGAMNASPNMNFNMNAMAMSQQFNNQNGGGGGNNNLNQKFEAMKNALGHQQQQQPGDSR